MNIKEANLSYLASPAAPFGLETAGRNQINSKIRNLKVQAVSLVAMMSSAACGSGTEAKATTSAIDTPAPVATGQKIAETSAPTVVVAPAPEVKVVVPVATATEAPKVEKTAIPVITVLDKPVTKVTIEQLKNEAMTTYDTKPESFKESDGTIYPKAYLEGGLKSCEKGSPDSAGLPKFVAQERLGSCAGIVRGMVVWYKNNGDPALMQIAIDARSYFISQYPELKGQFDSFLKQAGVN